MGRRPCGARCGQPPADPRPQGAQGVPGPAPPSGRPAATSTGPRPPRSPKPRVAAAPHRPPQSVWLSATAAAMPGGSAAAWRARGKERGGGHGERRGVGGPGSSRWAPAARPPMTAARFDQRLTTISSQLLANCTPSSPSTLADRDRFQDRGGLLRPAAGGDRPGQPLGRARWPWSTSGPYRALLAIASRLVKASVFRVAVSGRREQEASFFTVVVRRDQAEHAVQSPANGSRSWSFRLQQRAWTADDGNPRSVVEVVADELGPSLRWATATTTRATRSSSSSQVD